MSHKVGDTVHIIPKPPDMRYGDVIFFGNMDKYCGKVAKIELKFRSMGSGAAYRINLDRGRFMWSDRFF